LNDLLLDWSFFELKYENGEFILKITKVRALIVGFLKKSDVTVT